MKILCLVPVPGTVFLQWYGTNVLKLSVLAEFLIFKDINGNRKRALRAFFYSRHNSHLFLMQIGTVGTVTVPYCVVPVPGASVKFLPYTFGYIG